MAGAVVFLTWLLLNIFHVFTSNAFHAAPGLFNAIY